MLFGADFPALVLCAALMDFRRVIAWAVDGNAPALVDFGKIDFLLLAEWTFILAAAARSDFSGLKTGRFERVVRFSLALYALFLVPPVSHKFTIALCVYLAARLTSDFRLWRLGLCLALVGLQFSIRNAIFENFHAACILADAWGAHFLLLAGGYQNLVQGAVLRLVDVSHAVRIYAGCDTITALAPVACAYAIFILSSRGRLDARCLTGFGALVVLIFLENWLRLGLMTLSYGNYLFWHDGPGASLAAMANAVPPYLLSEAAVRRK